MKKVTIYTDGACRGNPGPGGWGAILMYSGAKKEISGGEPGTTNNRMELQAVISALGALKEPCRVELYTDSQYVSDAINKGWLKSWEKTGWRRGKIKNQDMWKDLSKLLNVHDVEFIWIRGHAENEFNNRCDEMAVEESRKF
jgi:ribonuclease HI